ncbi:MAG: DUF1569 domain-containing protein [Planctomycetaceae bacterium]|nr:DUF1569 domain-containing protein [Planctomycetaceae bacterium]
MVHTKNAPRRELSFHCTGCLKEELARIEAAEARGELATTGNWSAGEILDHVAKVWEFSLDGFPPEAKVAFPLQLVARLMKRRFTSGKTLPAGFQAGKGGQYMMPAAGTTTAAGLARLRRVVARLDAGEEMNKPSPAFGALTHDEWMRLHLAHAQLHLGFIRG